MSFSGGRISRRTFDQTVDPSVGAIDPAARTVDSSTRQAFRKLIDPLGLGRGLVDLPDYGPRTPADPVTNPEFSVVVERLAHDLGHSGDCGNGHLITPVRWSVDPMFYLLHSQVDREWAFWQQRRGRHGVLSGGSASFPAPTHYDNDGSWNSPGVSSWQMRSFIDAELYQRHDVL